MSEIATAYVQIEPTFKGVQGKIASEMGSAGESGGQSFGSGFAKVLNGTGGAIAGAGKAIAGAVAVGGAAVTALGASFVKSTGDVAAYGDNIDKMAQKMGLSIESYQEWDAVMQHSGTSMESMKASMKTLANAAETGNAAFETLGITQQEIAEMSQEQLFERTISELQQVEDDTQRTYLAGKLLGKGATELGALLNTSAEDTQAMRDRVRELGGVMSEDAVKAAAAYQDQLQDMQTAFSGLSRNLMSEFLPQMTTVMSGLTEIFAGNSEAGIGQITEGVKGILDGLMSALPDVLSVATQIVEALAQAILENIPQLATTGMDIVMELGTFIIENLPLLIQAATSIILEIATGLAQALPDLIPAIVDVVLTISEYLIDNIDILIDAAIQLMIGLATGLIQALPILIEKVPIIISKLLAAFLAAIPKLIEAAKQIITIIKNGLDQYLPQLLAKGQEIIQKLKDKIKEKVEQFKDIGRNIVEGIKQGIADMWDSLMSWFTDKLSGMLDAVKSFFGIESPSRVFADEVGKMIPLGIAKGIEDGMGVVDKTMEAMTKDMVNLGVSATMTENLASAPAQGNSDSALLNLLSTYLPMIAQGVKDPVKLEGDMGRLFRAMQRESIRNTQLVGTNAVLSAI